MNKIYYVIINGKTLESRNLKELLARAVSMKRNLDRETQIQSRFHPHASAESVSNSYNPVRPVATL